MAGKNNVLVLPKGSAKPQEGYLSLHNYILQSTTGDVVSALSSSSVAIDASSCSTTTSRRLVLKWTPNRLMNGATIEDKSASWQQAIHVDMASILFIHCHQVSPNHNLVAQVLMREGPLLMQAMQTGNFENFFQRARNKACPKVMYDSSFNSLQF